jgi:hypothetical protein
VLPLRASVMVELMVNNKNKMMEIILVLKISLKTPLLRTNRTFRKKNTLLKIRVLPGTSGSSLP